MKRYITHAMQHDFRARLRDREKLLGTMVTLPTPATAEILAALGFDWLFVDGEHGPLETREILAILQAVGRDVACVVRVPAADEVSIKKALDLGAAAVRPYAELGYTLLVGASTRSSSGRAPRRCSRSCVRKGRYQRLSSGLLGSAVMLSAAQW